MDPDPNTTIASLFMNANFGTREIGIIVGMVLLLFLSAFFSSTETAFTSFNKIRMKNLAQNGSKRATLVTKIENKYDRFLTSVLVGNNIVNILLSSIATIFFIGLFKDAVEDPDTLGSTVSTVVITVAVLIFGEITPKVIARQNADKMAMLLAPFINIIIYLSN
jgi:Mg2+/Co2+ transporter CorB